MSEDHEKALAMIRMAFDANGIKFAIPTIAGDGEPSAAATGAVAHRTLEFTKARGGSPRMSLQHCHGAHHAIRLQNELFRPCSPRSLVAYASCVSNLS